MTWRKTWRGRVIAIRGARWWRDGQLTVDESVADPKPCNDHFAMFGLYAAHVRDESGTPHRIEVVQRPWRNGKSLYQLVVDGALVSRGSRHAPEPPDWQQRELTEAHGYFRFLLNYWRSVVFFPIFIVVMRYLGRGFDAPSHAAQLAILVFFCSLGVHVVYVFARWRTFLRVNKCRRQKLFGAPAAQQGAAADVQQRVPIEVW